MTNIYWYHILYVCGENIYMVLLAVNISITKEYLLHIKICAQDSVPHHTTPYLIFILQAYHYKNKICVFI